MSRPLRLEFPGSLWHVGSKGNSGVRIFRDEHDRECFLGLLGRAVVRYRWTLLAYVLRRTYFELVIELAARTMSTGMQWLLSQYARWFNWRHDRVGHLFHHPFDGRLIERETFGLAVVRDVVLDPVRTALVERPEDFEWSSHRALIGEVEAPAWLATHEILGQFGAYAAIARERYKRFVDDGIAAQTLPWHDLVGGMYLGSELWIDEIQRRIDATPLLRAPRRPARARTTRSHGRLARRR